MPLKLNSNYVDILGTLITLMARFISLFIDLESSFIYSFQGSVNFKFGVLYAKAGQTTDDEMYSNGKTDLFLNRNSY